MKYILIVFIFFCFFFSCKEDPEEIIPTEDVRPMKGMVVRCAASIKDLEDTLQIIKDSSAPCWQHKIVPTSRWDCPYLVIAECAETR